MYKTLCKNNSLCLHKRLFLCKGLSFAQKCEIIIWALCARKEPTFERSLYGSWSKVQQNRVAIVAMLTNVSIAFTLEVDSKTVRKRPEIVSKMSRSLAPLSRHSRATLKSTHPFFSLRMHYKRVFLTIPFLQCGHWLSCLSTGL